ncbi:MAG: ABC transporter substrate-binding protein [Methanoregulaceae archaeon]|nr:ABC transporter substrate-binding protein [Methanoregulaceae archaeon]
MTIFLAVDDTDVEGSRGTGRLARAVGQAVSRDYPVFAVTRHQLYVHPDIPYTSHNSCAVVHILAGGDAAAKEIFDTGKEVVLGDFIEGSDPGIAVAASDAITPAIVAFGFDAKRVILTQEKARTLAMNSTIRLEGLGGTEDGVIGAVAGLGLASTGYDGRFLSCGRVRDMTGPQEACDLLEAGIDDVLTMDGRRIDQGRIMVEEGKSVKPCPVNGRVVLFVEDREGTLHAVKRD